MNFLNLQYFIVAAEEMNFTKAAKRLYISQQSLSNHIAKLEEYFGVQLFDRGIPLTLTSAGQSLLKNAQAIMDVKKQTELELKDIRDFKNADLTVGVHNARGAIMLPPLLLRFHREFPQVKLHLYEGTAVGITDALYKGKLDLTLGFALDDPEKIQTEILQQERCLIVVPNSIMEEYFSETERKKMAGKKKLPLETFSRCPFIKMRHSNWIGTVFEDCCRDKGMAPDVVLETGNIMTMVSLCVSGLGIIVCPAVFLGENSPVLRKSKLDQVNLFGLDYPDAYKMIAINFLKNKYQTKAAKEFIRMTKEYYRSLS